MASNKRISNSRFKENLPSAPDYMLGSDSLDYVKNILTNGGLSHERRTQVLRNYFESNTFQSEEVSIIANQYKSLVSQRNVKNKDKVLNTLDEIISKSSTQVIQGFEYVSQGSVSFDMAQVDPSKSRNIANTLYFKPKAKDISANASFSGISQQSKDQVIQGFEYVSQGSVSFDMAQVDPSKSRNIANTLYFKPKAKDISANASFSGISQQSTDLPELHYGVSLSQDSARLPNVSLNLPHTETLDEIENEANRLKELNKYVASLANKSMAEELFADENPLPSVSRTPVNPIAARTINTPAVSHPGYEEVVSTISEHHGVLDMGVARSYLGSVSEDDAQISPSQSPRPQRAMAGRRGGISTKLLGWKAIALAGTVAVAAGIGLYNFVTKGNNNSASNQGLEQKITSQITSQVADSNQVEYQMQVESVKPVATPETVQAMVKAPSRPGFPFNPGFNLPFGIGQTRTESPYTIPNTIRAPPVQEITPILPEVVINVPEVKTEVGQMREIRDPVEVSGIIFDRSEVGQMTLVDDSKPFNGKETLQSVSNKKSLGDLADQYRTYSVNEGSRDAGISVRKAGHNAGEGLESLANAVTLSHATKKGNKYRENDPKNIGQFFGNMFNSAGKFLEKSGDAILYSLGTGYAIVDLATIDGLPNVNKEYNSLKNPVKRIGILGSRGVVSAGEVIVHAVNAPTGKIGDNAMLPILDATQEFLEAGKHLTQAAGNATIRPAVNLVTKNSERGNKVADYMFVVPTEWATNSITGQGFTNLTKENIAQTAATKGPLGATLEFIASGLGLGYGIHELTSSSSGSSKGGITGGEGPGVGGK